MKICKKCNKEKTIDQFRFIRKNKNGTDLYKAQCNDCFNQFYIEKYRNKTEEERKKIYEEKKEKTTFESRKNTRLIRNFNLTLEEYDDMLQKQNNCCYICEKHIQGNEVKVDHSHKTKKVRKLLCHHCNTALGLLREDKKLFEKCVDYLEQHDSI